MTESAQGLSINIVLYLLVAGHLLIAILKGAASLVFVQAFLVTFLLTGLVLSPAYITMALVFRKVGWGFRVQHTRGLGPFIVAAFSAVLISTSVLVIPVMSSGDGVPHDDSYPIQVSYYLIGLHEVEIVDSSGEHYSIGPSFEDRCTDSACYFYNATEGRDRLNGPAAVWVLSALIAQFGLVGALLLKVRRSEEDLPTWSSPFVVLGLFLLVAVAATIWTFEVAENQSFRANFFIDGDSTYDGDSHSIVYSDSFLWMWFFGGGALGSFMLVSMFLMTLRDVSRSTLWMPATESMERQPGDFQMVPFLALRHRVGPAMVSGRLCVRSSPSCRLWAGDHRSLTTGR